VRITGPAVLNLQRHFMVNWFAIQNLPVWFDPSLFPDRFPGGEGHSGFAQIVPGGPVYSFSNIMLSYFKLFTRAKEKLYITNPYFIPSDSIMDALKQAALAGVDVRLLLPYKSDSALVGAASRFYFRPLLQAGVRIFLYQKGFVHAKTVVADARLSVVGTANMDIRSFDLNFEIMPLIYSESFGAQLEQVFLKDLTECVELNYEEWQQTSRAKQLLFSIARLISSFL
jgi:cardiolipin synthase